jgi:hypothetical protein
MRSLTTDLPMFPVMWRGVHKQHNTPPASEKKTLHRGVGSKSCAPVFVLGFGERNDWTGVYPEEWCFKATQERCQMMIKLHPFDETWFETLFLALDSLHDAVSEQRVSKVSSVAPADMVGWLEDIIYTAQEAIVEIRENAPDEARVSRLESEAHR